ncbi:MAG: hypothetical protein HWE30_19190 [Methylocystaceae bacterium]|nr:hypothetical protein [Methylocystaceae bacterium]
MNEYESYKEFLDYLEYRKYSWHDVDKLIKFYQSLNLEGRERFNADTPAFSRFTLMNSYLSKLCRTYSSLSLKKKISSIEEMIFFISLDNFENDYKESILRTQRFLREIKLDEPIFREIWSNLSQSMPKITKCQITRLAEMEFRGHLPIF